MINIQGLIEIDCLRPCIWLGFWVAGLFQALQHTEIKVAPYITNISHELLAIRVETRSINRKPFLISVRAKRKCAFPPIPLVDIAALRREARVAVLVLLDQTQALL